MPSEMSEIRQYVADVLTPFVPATWRFEPGIATLDRTLSAPIMWLEYSSFQPLEETNPAALAVAAVMDICVATNRTDVRKGEAEADDMVAELYHSLIAAAKFYGLTAQKVVFEQAYAGWRITVTIATNAKPRE